MAAILAKNKKCFQIMGLALFIAIIITGKAFSENEYSVSQLGKITSFFKQKNDNDIELKRRVRSKQKGFMARIGENYSINHTNAESIAGFEKDVEDQTNIVPFLIIGGGPAGMSAAIYASRSKMPTVLLDDHETVKGGTSMVENWPGIYPIKRKDLFARLKGQAEGFGATVVYDAVKKVDFSRWPYIVLTQSGNEFKALSIIIATGSSLSHSPIENEEQYWGKGIAPCSYCDAPRAQGKEVVVCGDGVHALMEALNIAPYARNVTVVLSCDSSDVALNLKQKERLARYKDITIQYNSHVEKVDGDGMWIKNLIVRSPENEKQTMSVDMLFVSSTRKGNSDLFSDVLRIDKNGYIQLNKYSQEAYKGIYVAGEVQDNIYRQAAVAAGDGIKAAIEAIQFLENLGFDYAKIKEIKTVLHPLVQEKIEHELTPHLESVNQLEQVKNKYADEYVVVMFHAHGCHYCHEMMPVFQSIASSYIAKEIPTTFYLADVQNVSDFIQLLNIDGVPLFCIFHKGELLRKKEGVMKQEELLSFINGDSE